MSIDFNCACGKRLHAPDGSNGKRARCPKCGNTVTIPDLVLDIAGESASQDDGMYDTVPAAPAPRMAHASTPPPSAETRKTSAYTTSKPRLDYASPEKATLRRFAYLLLILTLIPLILSTFKPHESFLARLIHTVTDHPDVAAELDKRVDAREEMGDDLGVSEKEILDLLPDHKLDGALLSHDSKTHWLMALAAATAYFSAMLLIFPNASKYTKGLLFAGTFTATIGVLILLAFQYIAAFLPGIIPRSPIGLVLVAIKFIGYSYSMADDPRNGFFLSFLGFTAGVGLCEEICKAMPILFRIKTVPGEAEPTWNSLMLWGLASGIGFGIAEGIMYSGRYYNGIESADIYYVRFISCVALHAMWSGAVGICIYRNQGDLLGADSYWTYFFHLFRIAIIPMVLHGLYDTLLKKDMDTVALVVAVATFGYLAYQIETQRRRDTMPATA